MTDQTVPSIALNNGTSIPQLGFGVFKVEPDHTARVVGDALDAGYRHLDTAKLYHNEEGVGRALKESGIAREEVFVTTKLWNSDQGAAQESFDASLARLGLDYVDLYLIHWPAPQRGTFVQAWKDLERIAASGRARAIGVSNFLEEHLEQLLQETSTVPAVNQVELHVDFQQTGLRAFHDEHGIVTEAWGPLGQGRINSSPELRSIAEKHGKTLAQVILRWHLQSGIVAIPKSNRRERMDENIAVFDFSLDDDEMAAIAALDRGEEGRNSAHPRETN